MAKKEDGGSMMQKVGSWAFIAGMVIAIIAGLISGGSGGKMSALIVSVLAVLGLIVGFLNVTGKETTPFLIATVSLVVITSLGGTTLGNIDVVGPYMSGIFAAIMTFVIPATIIVALKAIYALAADE